VASRSEAPLSTIVVTGATAGIGLESALQLAADGHRLVLVGRSREKLDAAEDAVRRAGSERVDTHVADFASLDSVRDLARDLLERYEQLDVVISNAGTVFARRTVTDDGLEATFEVNHLSGFLLVELLKQRLVCSAPARVVITSSVGHFSGTLDLDDLGFERGYTIMRAYARSKLANAMYARSLAAELEGTGVTVNAVHPGSVATDIWSGAPWFARPFLTLAKRRMLSPAEGGQALTNLAVSPDVQGVTGQYFDRFTPRSPSKVAQDDELGRRLREESARLVGLPVG
jgi:NAD(P)-dependent dehydrogenase (short-subunit alcohol dehydrogenase family)